LCERDFDLFDIYYLLFSICDLIFERQLKRAIVIPGNKYQIANHKY